MCSALNPIIEWVFFFGRRLFVFTATSDEMAEAHEYNFGSLVVVRLTSLTAFGRVAAAGGCNANKISFLFILCRAMGNSTKAVM